MVSYLAAHRLNAETRDPDEDSPFTGRMSLTAPEAFRHVARFDAAMNLISKVLEPVPEDRWEGTATVHGPHSLRTVHLAMRSMPAPHQHAWRGIIHDVTDTVTPAEPTPRLGRPHGRDGRAGTHRGRADGRRAGPAHHLVHRSGPRHPVERHPRRPRHPHPDDVVRIFQTMQRLRTGGEKTAAIPGVRLRRLQGGWTVVDSRTVITALGR